MLRPQALDRLQPLEGLRHCLHSKDMALRIELIDRQCPPQRFSRNMVVPDFRQSQSEDQDVGPQQSVAHQLPPCLGSFEGFLVLVAPEYSLVVKLAKCPSELLSDTGGALKL